MTKSTVEDKSKLKCVLQFLKQKIDDKSMMRTYKLIYLFTWVDDVYGVHPDIKIHNGGGM